MNILYNLGISIITILITVTFFIRRKEHKQLSIKIISILVFLIFLVRLFSSDSIYSVFIILLTDITTPINSPDTWLFSPLLTILIIILRW